MSEEKKSIFVINIDDKISPLESLVYGAQHMLIVVMTPFVVPIMFASLFGITLEQTALLVITMLIFAGISTLTRPVFNLPIMEAQSILYIVVMIPLVYMYGFGTAYLSMLIAGLIASALVLPIRKYGLIGKISPYISSPLVLGPLFIVMGVSLVPAVCIPMIFPDYLPASVLPIYALIAAVSFFVPFILTLLFPKGFLRYTCFLIGIIVAALLAAALGMIDLTATMTAPWFIPLQLFPLGFSLPPLDVLLTATFLMLIANLADFIDSLGCFSAVFKMTGQELDELTVNRALFVETFISSISTIFGNVPTTSYSQNIGVLAMTRVAAKRMIYAGGIMLIVLGLFYKFGVFIASIPSPVYGGALLLTFGTLIVVGFDILKDVEWTEENKAIVGFSIAAGLISMIMPSYFLNTLPSALALLFSSPVVVTVLIALAFDLLLNKFKIIRPIKA